jgi:hypothetical protein
LCESIVEEIVNTYADRYRPHRGLRRNDAANPRIEGNLRTHTPLQGEIAVSSWDVRRRSIRVRPIQPVCPERSPRVGSVGRKADRAETDLVISPRGISMIGGEKCCRSDGTAKKGGSRHQRTRRGRWPASQGAPRHAGAGRTEQESGLTEIESAMTPGRVMADHPLRSRSACYLDQYVITRGSFLA